MLLLFCLLDSVRLSFLIITIASRNIVLLLCAPPKHLVFRSFNRFFRVSLLCWLDVLCVFHFGLVLMCVDFAGAINIFVIFPALLYLYSLLRLKCWYNIVQVREKKKHEKQNNVYRGGNIKRSKRNSKHFLFGTYRHWHFAISIDTISSWYIYVKQ